MQSLLKHTQKEIKENLKEYKNTIVHKKTHIEKEYDFLFCYIDTYSMCDMQNVKIQKRFGIYCRILCILYTRTKKIVHNAESIEFHCEYIDAYAMAKYKSMHSTILFFFVSFCNYISIARQSNLFQFSFQQCERTNMFMTKRNISQNKR